jgi:hypothetical protein
MKNEENQPRVKRGFNPDSEAGTGAHASRVSVRASRPNFGCTPFQRFSGGKSLSDDVFGATPKTTRETRALPKTFHARFIRNEFFGLSMFNPCSICG